MLFVKSSIPTTDDSPYTLHAVQYKNVHSNCALFVQQIFANILIKHESNAGSKW